ncbi:MAG TPA: enoyl-CoA hydratase-related protein [Acidimicrobiales bacterium]
MGVHQETDYSSFTFIDVVVDDDGIAVATLNRPDKLNAADRVGHGEFAKSLRAFAADDRVKVVVLRAAGKAFSVGGSWDYEEELSSDRNSQWRVHREARDLVYAHLELDKPVITALQGYAFGSGTAYALLADFVIVERHVKFGDGHVFGGMPAGDGGVLIWPLSIGMIRAKKYLLTGDVIDAVEAERIGLVTEVVETGESFDRAMALARRLAAGPQRAMRYTKRALNQQLRQAALTSFDMSLSLELESMYFGDEFAEYLRVASSGEGLIDRSWQWRPPPA